MSALGLGLGLGLGRHRKAGGESPDMILVYEIPAAGTNIELAIQANSTWFGSGQEAVIDWGDGSAAETVSATSGQSGYIGHTYAAAGTYTIKISGSMTMYGRSSNVNIAGQTLLTRIDSFGKLGITSFYSAFYGCTGLTSVPKTLPDSVTNMYGIFYGCITANNINLDVSKWDVSNVTDMRFMFRDCTGAAFNPDVSKWDVSNVIYMASMFRGCIGSAFKPDMKSWTLRTGVLTVDMFRFSKTQPTAWLDELLIAWAANPEQGNDITIDFSPNKFTDDGAGNPLPAVASALTYLTTTKGWNITTANPYSST